MQNTKVRELMTDEPIIVSPDATLTQAAELMKLTDCGMLPVGMDGKLMGIITDRDIIIRAIAHGKNPSREIVENYMTKKVYACNEDDFLEDAAKKMREHKVGRLIVRNEKGKTVGILSFGGILRKNASAEEVANIVKHAVHKAAA